MWAVQLTLNGRLSPAHHGANLTVFGRRPPVYRILADGMAVAHATDLVGMSRQTAWKWLRQFEACSVPPSGGDRARLLTPTEPDPQGPPV